MSVKQTIKESLGKCAGFWLHQHRLKGKTVVFTFHRVLPLADFESCHFQRSLVVSDRAFDSFLNNLRQHFEVLAMSDFLKQDRAAPAKNSRPQALITFDDGWRDNHDVALPLLRRYDLPATIFLSTDFIGSDSGFWWQNLGDYLSTTDFNENKRRAIKALIDQHVPNHRLPDCFSERDRFIELLKSDYYPYIASLSQALFDYSHYQTRDLCLSWQQCEQMSKQGIEFGSHSCSHPRLSLLSTEQLQHELAESRRCIMQQPLNYVDVICYPYGDQNQATQTQAASLYKMGVGTGGGIIDYRQTNWFNLPRIHVSEMLAASANALDFRIFRAL